MKKCGVPLAQTINEEHVVGCGWWPSDVQVNGGWVVVVVPSPGGSPGFGVVPSPGGGS